MTAFNPTSRAGSLQFDPFSHAVGLFLSYLTHLVLSSPFTRTNHWSLTVAAATKHAEGTIDQALPEIVEVLVWSHDGRCIAPPNLVLVGQIYTHDWFFGPKDFQYTPTNYITGKDPTPQEIGGDTVTSTIAFAFPRSRAILTARSPRSPHSSPYLPISTSQSASIARETYIYRLTYSFLSLQLYSKRVYEAIQRLPHELDTRSSTNRDSFRQPGWPPQRFWRPSKAGQAAAQ